PTRAPLRLPRPQDRAGLLVSIPPRRRPPGHLQRIRRGRWCTMIERNAFACLASAILVVVFMSLSSTESSTGQTTMPAPSYAIDPFWPKPLPNNWIVGAVVGVAVDRRDHVWITHRPSTLQPNETRSIWRAAPPVLEFDESGTLVSSWGGPG